MGAQSSSVSGLLLQTCDRCRLWPPGSFQALGGSGALQSHWGDRSGTCRAYKWVTGPFRDDPWPHLTQPAPRLTRSSPRLTGAAWFTRGSHQKGPGHLLTSLLIIVGFDFKDGFLVLSFLSVTRCYIRTFLANGSFINGPSPVNGCWAAVQMHRDAVGLGKGHLLSPGRWIFLHTADKSVTGAEGTADTRVPRMC